MKLILSHPTGNSFVRAAAKGFFEKDMLLNFTTSVSSFPGGFLDRLGGFGPFSEIRRRRYDSSLQPYTKSWPWMEVGRMAARKVGLNYLVKHEEGFFCVDAVYRYQDKKVATLIDKEGRNKANLIYAYEDGALASFKAAKKTGLNCVYDLPIGYWRAARELMLKERQLKPEWASTILGFNDSDAKLARKDEEIELADLIIVASKFTAETLKLYPGTLPPVKIIPYAFPEVGEPKKYPKPGETKPLKILFVGGLSQRKGIAYLFEAVSNLKFDFELTIVGQKSVPNCKALNKALEKYNWIKTLPHSKILKLMRENDVLVFPSLFEGFGLVITEAMSQGTPVITTNRTAGPDLIRHGENGWIIEAGSSTALRSVIEEISSNPDVIEKLGLAAMETAKNRTWNTYGRDLAEVIRQYRISIQ